MMLCSADLKKSPEECWVTGVGLVLSELNLDTKNLRRWMGPERGSNQPAQSSIEQQGVERAPRRCTDHRPVELSLS